MKKSFSLQELAALIDAELIGDPSFIVAGVADLATASPGDISFLAHTDYLPVRFDQAMARSHAGAIVIAPNKDRAPGRHYLLHADPSRSFQQIVEAFHPAEERSSAFNDIHPTAIIHPTATIGRNVSIAPYAVIDRDASIGEATQIGPHCYIGAGTIIGSECLLYARVVVREQCRLGDRVIVQPGAIIGSCGFGYTTDRQGRHTKLSQLGTVHIEDDVEIGANATIDRARFGLTKICRGSKIDNGVQIAHGVTIGEHNLLAAHTAIAGSSETGSHVVMGGQVGVTGHVKIVSGTMIAAQAGVSKSIETPGKYAGRNAMPLSEYTRNAVMLRSITKTIQSTVQQELNKERKIEQSPPTSSS